ncbi:MAG: phosphoribosylanthranilate isomerase [Alphaproteobacteria bacterium]
MIRIKNCGLRHPSEIEAAAASGATFVGLVHHATSPRHLTLEAMSALASHIHAPVQSVVVLVDPSDAILQSITTKFLPDYWQIHGLTDAMRLREIHEITKIPVIAAVAVAEAKDIAQAQSLTTAASMLLFDTKHEALAGGGGKAFDWELLSGLRLDVPWFLAGGLTAENVTTAIRITGAKLVDVSSGIESRPGEKSLEKIAAFNRAVLQTKA